MNIMEEYSYAENEVHSARPQATRDWLRHANQSLSRLKDVKKSAYQLGGGPREREVNCQCNYRSKSKSSFLSMEAEPPQIALDSQETASMPDLSIPEIVKQFNERQSQASKQKRRPHSSAVYSTKNTTGKQDREKASDSRHKAFITVKGQTVTPQVRPPHGPLLITDIKKDESAYKGLVYLDPQQVEQHRTSTLEGLRRYSAAFCDNEDPTNAIPPPPRASPEPTSPRTNSPEFIESAEECFSEDGDDIINKSSEMRSVSSAGSRSLVFAIPTAFDEGSEDEESQSDFKAGRLSADYVAKSKVLLDEISEKNHTEAAEISGMLLDMENAKEKINQLRISPRDLELGSVKSEPGHRDRSGASTPSVHMVNMQLECPTVDETRPEDGCYETFWVEEPVDTYISNALPYRNSRACSARYMNQQTKESARVRRHQSEGSLLLKGKTMEFFNSEDLVARNRMRDSRRTLKPNEQFSDEEHSRSTGLTNKVATKPPLPKWNTTKSNKKKIHKNRSVNSDSVQNQPSKSSLRKSNSEGNIHESVTHLLADSNLTKKSVSFSQDVLNQESLASCEISTRDDIEDKDNFKQTHKSDAWTSSSGVVIQNGLEMKETVLEESGPDTEASQHRALNVGHKANQSTRAKLLAKMKEIPRDEEPCPCRTVTRPTAALLTVSRSGQSGTKEISSKNEKLLKSRSTRPSSAPIKRSPGNCGELTTVKPTSPRRKPRAMSATVQRKRTGSEGGQSRPRPSSAHVGKSSSKDARRSRAAAKVLKEGYLFKERPPPQLPPGSKERQQKREVKSTSKESKEENNNSVTRNKEEDEVVASEECHEVFARLQQKGIAVSMDTIKRGLMAPARTASDFKVPTMDSSSGLLSRPENWLTEEHARIQIWDNALKSSK